MIVSLFKYSFLQNAFIASILASVICGIAGTVIMEKKLVMMSGGIAHTSFGGIGLGYLLGVEPIFTALIFAVGASLAISMINKKAKTNTDLLTGIFWSVGMALGVLFIALTPGYPPDMTSYLFGDILTVSRQDLLIMLLLNILILFFVLAFFNILTAYLFDGEFASVIRLPVNVMDYILFVFIAVTVVILIRVAGIVMIIALLSAPPAIAKLLSKNLKNIMLLSIFSSLVFCISGLWISYWIDIPSGSAIVLVSGCTYFLLALVKRIRKSFQLSETKTTQLSK